ncbi:MAG: hypothetical protein J5809_07445 [Selenomonadaceae bacterium]|nr:hypothetical protein [Selenomonadaceae bacterium]
MSKILVFFFLSVTMIISGCMSAKQVSKKSIAIEVTPSEAQAKLKEMSRGLVVYYDDMKDAIICRVDANLNDVLLFVPRVEINNQFEPELYLQIFHTSRRSLYFDKLYIRSANGTAEFKVSTGNEYNGLMSREIYQSLKDGVMSEYIKIRIAGRDMDERELTAEEIAQIDKVFTIYEYLSKVKVTN